MITTFPVIRSDPVLEGIDVIVPSQLMDLVESNNRSEDQTISDILQRVSYGQTLDIRQQALHEFHRTLLLENHGFHLAAMNQGADRILSWQFTQQLSAQTTDPQSVVLILISLELLWGRCSSDLLQRSASGLLDVVPWLLHAWMRFPDHDNLVELVLTVLRCWAKIRDTNMKSRLLRSGVVTCIEAEVTRRSPNRRWALIVGLVKDLSFRCSRGDKEYMYLHMKHFILTHCQDESIATAEAMTATLWNLATESSVAEVMVEDREFWTSVANTWSTTMNETRLPIHRNITSAVGSVVACLTMGGGRVSLDVLAEQTWLVPSLLRVLKTENDSDRRRRSMRTLRCLASSEWGSSFMLQNAGSINELLTEIIRAIHNDHDDDDTRIQACQATIHLFETKVAELSSFCTILKESLSHITEDHRCNDKLFIVAAQALVRGAGQSLWASPTLDFPHQFCERIQIVLERNSGEPYFHASAADIFTRLIAGSNSTGDLLMITCKPVTESFRILLEATGPEFELSRNCGVEMLKTITADSSCKKPLAENEGLLTALVNFCLVANGPVKDDAKAILLALVPEL